MTDIHTTATPASIDTALESTDETVRRMAVRNYLRLQTGEKVLAAFWGHILIVTSSDARADEITLQLVEAGFITETRTLNNAVQVEGRRL